MDPWIVGSLGLCTLFFLMFLGMPIAFAMALVGSIGFGLLGSLQGALYTVGQEVFLNASSYTYSVLALFILMGEFASYGKISERFFKTAFAWLGHLPGGLAMATIAGCAGFAAVSGSSTATALTMGRVAIPEMNRYEYDPKLSTGTVAAGGTLGILIPPSSVFIVYGALTGESIAKLFIAGLLPGLLLAFLFILTVLALVKLNPRLAKKGRKTRMREKLSALAGVVDMLALIFLILGGLYAGFFTPNEAAGVGATAALIIGLARRSLTRDICLAAFLSALKTIGMIYALIIGASIFNKFMALTNIPTLLTNFVLTFSMPPVLLIAAICLVYLFLGCIMDSLAITLITIPILTPIFKVLGIDLVWFGVIFCICVEMALITPPVGINVWALSGIVKDVPMQVIFRGIFPFLFPMLLCLATVIAFPQVALFLPNLIK